jgi:dCTP diphosphatase
MSLQVGEVGELSEIFQWKGEVPKGLPGWEERETEHLGEELADVLLYLVRLSDMCKIDLAKAALRKIELNARKYPAGTGQASGSSRKRAHSSDDIIGTGEDCGSMAAAAGDSKEEH